MGPLSLFSRLIGCVAVRFDKPIIDNGVFRAHYRWTTSLFFFCSMLIIARSYFGESISCHSLNEGYDHILTGLLDWCVTLPPNIVSPYPGKSSYNNEQNREKFHLYYYEWIPFILVFQGFMFQIPHRIWKRWEEGRIGVITKGLSGVVTGMPDEKIRARNQLVNYLEYNLHKHNAYATRYFICEVLNFVNIVVNVFLTDKFLGGQFFTYGNKFLQYSLEKQENHTDPTAAIFPKVAKCTFQDFATSEIIQRHDALCVFKINHINEKIYMILWFWLLVLAVFSSLTVLYSMALYTMPKLRELILVRRFKFGTNKAVTKLIKRLKVGDFLVIYFLGQNLDFGYFDEVMTELSHHRTYGRSLRKSTV